VTNAEVVFLRTRNPFLVSQTIAHILRGSLSRAVLSLLLAALLLAIVWIVAASLGRMATVEAMLEYFRSRFAADIPQDAELNMERGVPHPGRFASLFRLNFLRLVGMLATFIGFAGAALLAGFTSPPAHPRPGLATLSFVTISAIVAFVGYELNWLLSLGAVFVVRDGEDAVGSISSAVELCRKRSRAVFAVGTWTGIAHLVTFVAASTVVGFPIGLAGVLPWRVIALLVILVTLAYLAVADWLCTDRFAGYVCIAELPDVLLAPPEAPIIPFVPVPSETIDREELILSDVPNAAEET
jgi:hypothetical protein